jgi:NTP pyrophosphatase (non-canonical NTP hydrolase)
MVGVQAVSGSGTVAMADASTTLAELKDAVARFAAERQWEPFHTPKNLSMSLAVEAAELMEHFLWVDGETSRRLVQDPARREAIADEVADVACLLLNFSNVIGLDLSEAIRTKMVKNALKYPVEKYRGRFEAGD